MERESNWNDEKEIVIFSELSTSRCLWFAALQNPLAHEPTNE